MTGGARKRSSRSAFARGLAALLAVMSVLPLRTASSAPADIFSIAAPVSGADAPKARDIKDGDATVSTQTGSVSWSYPIAVPPGRNGMAPTGLSLSYSSQAPIYGGIAAGFAWNLGVPEIREDTSESRLKTHSPHVEITEQDPRKDDRFIGLGGRRLVPVVEPTGPDVYAPYRAQADDGYQRYERLASGPPYWRVRSTDGSVMEFGGSSAVCSNVSEGYAPLTRTVDRFGNAVTYTYEEHFASECRLRMVEWGANAGAAVSNFARVELMWQAWAPECNGVRVGSHTDYRNGTEIVTGSSTLAAIVVTAFPPGQPASPVHTRQILLQYSAPHLECTRSHAPLRLLTSIQESAWITSSPAVDLPAVTLEYGDPALVFANPGTPGTAPWGAWHSVATDANNLAWGYRYASASTGTVDRTPTIEEMMIDLDGDSLPDRLVNTSRESLNGSCSALWQKNEGPDEGSTEPNFGATLPINLPRLKWNGLAVGDPNPPPQGGGATASAGRGEKCSLAGQVTAFWNSMDVSSCHNGLPGGAACRTATNEDDPTLYCDPNGRECPAAQTVPRAEHTYLHYRWIDADGDGLIDLVAAVHGDVRTYDIEQGNYTISDPPDPEPDLFGPWPACPSDVDRCKDVNPDCVTGANGDPFAINTCIVQAATIPCNDLIKSPSGAPQSIERGPYMRCEGLYPWFIFKNTGNGSFASPVIKYQPVPLESDRGDSSLDSPTGSVSQNHGIIDFDGDGILDAIAKPDEGGGAIWWVWFGDGTGGFEPTRRTFFTQSGGVLSRSGFVPVVGVGTTEGLFDLNADGYMDHWKEIASQGNANVWFNTGTKHSAAAATVTPYVAGQYGVKPGDDADHDITIGGCINPPPGTECTYYAGTTRAENRVFDYDNDGRVDLVKKIPIGRPWVFFNLGGQFNNPPYEPINSNVQGLKRLTNVIGQDQLPEGIWKLLGDHIDLDGDGISEIVDFESGSYKRARQLNTEPPRLLTKVHNGRGAHTTIAYASMHDKTTVLQDTTPAGYWIDRWGHERPSASPRTQWVAKSVTTTDDFSNTNATTSYFYKHPRYGADDEGKYAFRGFDEVTTTSPTGAKTIHGYEYNVDWSGRLVETVVQPSASESIVEGEVRSFARVQWTSRQLFGNAIETYHVTLNESFTCSNGKDLPACEGTPAGYMRTESQQTALVSDLAGGDPLMWMDTSSTLMNHDGPPTDGDRKTTKEFWVQSDGTTYRVLPVSTLREHRDNGAWVMYGKTKQEWDPMRLVPITNEVWVNDIDADRSITHFDYDLTTGNLRKRWKPKQWAANKFTEYLYDSRKMLVATEINELGHQVNFTYEYGTGTNLMTEGPNQRTCTTGPGCPLDATHPLKEQHKVVVDGFGRTIETWDTVSTDGTLYELWQRSTTSYVDTFIPNSVTNKVRLSTTSSVWTETTTDLDGHGRPIRETSLAGGAPANHVTVYGYRSNGTLERVQVPNPTQNDASLVTYWYWFDSLGRPTRVRRPDGALEVASGVKVTYNGLETVTEAVTHPDVGGGEPVSMTTIRDSFGRIAEVRELRDTATWATTTYEYGPDDSVSTVTDPEGVVTTMKHDFAGHRKEISRYGRTWKYQYDANGNLESEIAPGSPNPPVTDPDYTTTIVYDDLDRPESKLIGQRSLSPSDQTLFASRTETYEWDIGGNMIGHLRYWRSFSPNQTTAEIVHSTRFSNQGQLITAIQNIEIAGYPELERRFGLRYHLFGGVSETWFEDPLGGTNKSKAFTYYDARALPTHMVLKRGGQPDHTLAVQTRNVAGLVTKRRTDTTGAMTFIESNWTYDKLGRVSSQVVQKGPGPTQVVRQELFYTGHDNPKQLMHFLGDDEQQFDFTFDSRHQLKTVSSTTPGYFDANYDYGSGGRFTRATHAQTINPLPDGTEVKPRDVNYVYGDADPERVTALTNVSDGSTYAGYSYDEAGNMTQRCYGGSGVPTCAGEAVEYVYDGKDQLRRATKKLGGVVQASEEYWYNGDGQRIAVVKRDAAGTKTEMIWFIGGTQAHYDGAGNVAHIYSHLSLGTPVARVDRTSNTTTSVEYQFHGLASNTIAAVAQDGTINASFSYAPFGEVIEATNAGGTAAGTPAHKRRFNDKYLDDLSALAYYGARYYDKTLIGWTQADPLYRLVPDLAKGSTPRRANLYQFTLGNPLRYLDPDGLDSVGWCWNSPSGCRHDDGPAVTSVGGGKAAKITTAGGSITDCQNLGPGACEAVANGATVEFGSMDDMVKFLGDGSGTVTSGPWGPILVTWGQRLRDGAQRLASSSAGQKVAAAWNRVNSTMHRLSTASTQLLFGTTNWGAIAMQRVRQLGSAGERAVRAAANIGQKVAVQINGRLRIPDGLTSRVLSEVKNVKYLSYTRQLRDFADYARQNGLRFDLWVRTTTQLSQPLAQEVANGAINLRFIP